MIIIRTYTVSALFCLCPPPPKWKYVPPPLPIIPVSRKRKKSGTLDFRYFDNRKYSIFWFHQIKHCFWKEWYQDHWFWLTSFDSMVISQNIVIVNFLFILVTFQSGIMAFVTSIHCCPKAHWSVQTKQRENLWTAIPAVNSSRRFDKIRKWLCFQKWL